MSPTEVLGFLTGAVNVWLLARQNIWNWPVGIANNALYLVLFVRSGLYGDAGLQAVYIALAVYGWWAWLRLRTGAAPEGPELSVARTPTRTWTWLAPATLAAFFTLTWFLRRFTDSTVPRWDALTTALSLAATYGQCRKYIESWWLWIAADVIYIPLYLYKSLHLTALLYFVFLLLCIMGLREWRKKLLRRSPPVGILAQ